MGILLATGGGCVKENMRLTIGQDLALETFTPDYQNATTAAIADRALAQKAANLQEMGWKEVDFPVPNDGVGHRPTYRTEYARVKKTARQRREAPSVESALELGEDTRDIQMYEAFVFTPGILIYDAFTMPFRMIAYPGIKHVRYSPRFTYQRDPININRPEEACTLAAATACANPACTDECKCAPGACECGTTCGAVTPGSK